MPPISPSSIPPCNNPTDPVNSIFRSRHLPYRCYGISTMLTRIYITPITFDPPGLSDDTLDAVRAAAARAARCSRLMSATICFTDPPHNLALILDELKRTGKKYP